MRSTLLGGTALRLIFAGMMTLGTAGYAGGALAQTADTDSKARGQMPGEKTSDTRPEFTRVGSFVFQPKIEIGATYDDNIYVDPVDEEGDLIFTVAPRVDVKSNFSRHGVSAYVYGDFNIFSSNGDDNYYNFGLGTEGVIDIARVWKVVGGVSYDNLHERRGRDDDPNTAEDEPVEPVNHDRVELYMESHTRFARGKLVGRLFYQMRDFEDAERGISGQVLEQDDRDRDVLGAEGRLTLDLFDLYSPFLDISLESIDYDKRDFVFNTNPPTSVNPADYSGTFDGAERDGERFRIMVGTDVDLTGVLFGSVGIGYGSRSFDDTPAPNSNLSLKNISGFEWDLGLTWLPTQLTAIDFNLSRDVGETTANGASGFYATDALVAVSHEATRDLTLGAHLGYTLREYEGISRDDDTLRTGVGATYDINRNFDVNARYEYWDRDSDNNAFDYSRNLLSVTFTAKL